MRDSPYRRHQAGFTSAACWRWKRCVERRGIKLGIRGTCTAIIPSKTLRENLSSPTNFKKRDIGPSTNNSDLQSVYFVTVYDWISRSLAPRSAARLSLRSTTITFNLNCWGRLDLRFEIENFLEFWNWIARNLGILIGKFGMWFWDRVVRKNDRSGCQFLLLRPRCFLAGNFV